MFKNFIYAVMYLFMVKNTNAKTLIKTINIDVNIDVNIDIYCKVMNKDIENQYNKIINLDNIKRINNIIDECKISYDECKISSDECKISYDECRISCDECGICYLNNCTYI